MEILRWSGRFLGKTKRLGRPAWGGCWPSPQGAGPAQRGETLRIIAQHAGEHLVGVASWLDDATTSATQANRTGVAEWDSTRPIEEHPLWGVVGLGRSGLSDLAANHDHYLAEILAEESDTWPQSSS